MAPLDQPRFSDSNLLRDVSPDLPGVSREDAEAAVRTLLIWAGDDPEREGLRDTPSRVANAYA